MELSTETTRSLLHRPAHTITARSTFAVLLTVSKILKRESTILPPYSSSASIDSAMVTCCLLHASLVRLDSTISAGKMIPREWATRLAGVTPTPSPFVAEFWFWSAVEFPAEERS